MGYLSTFDAITTIISNIIEGIEERQHIWIAACDISKAFDCVSHHLPCDKLEFEGGGGGG